MVDGASHHLHLAGGEVSLEVGRIVLRIPEAELDEGKQREVLRSVTLILHDHPVDLAGIGYRNKGGQRCCNAVLLSFNDGIAKAVSALVEVERRLRRLPAGVPDRSVLVVTNIVVTAALIERAVVVAVACKTQKLRIFIEVIAARRIGDQPEEVLASQVVDPRQRSLRCFDDVLEGVVVKMPVFH